MVDHIKKIITSGILFTLLFSIIAKAETVDDIKSKIENQNSKIKQLEQEIQIYETEIQKTSTQAQSLQSAVKVLDTNQKKISTEIKKTETNISKTNLTLQELSDEINNIENEITSNTQTIAKAINEMRESDDTSLIENFLVGNSISDVLNNYESLDQLQEKIKEKSIELANYKLELSGKKTATEGEKTKLVSLKSNLSDQNQVLTINKKEKTTLLTATKNKESEYQTIVAQKKAQKEQFEAELYQYESQLKKAIDPGSFPSSKKGILSWPLDNIYITQYFGVTVDSKRLYKSGTHNGVDFGTSIGTPVKAALSGVVKGFGNTDEQKGCYSFGKWILVEHPNGLSTLYAHLSIIKVSVGQQVSTGDIIGYSGNTGYSTGPHLHLTVYATQGIVGIQKYSSSIGCKNVSIPIADVNAYLDPMLYLPSLSS